MRIDLDVVLASSKSYATPLRSLEVSNVTENIVVLHLRGSLVHGAPVSFFLEQIRLLIGRGMCNVVVDLLDAARIDNRGVGGLAAAYNSICDARGKINYVAASNEVLFALCKNGLDQLFEIYQDKASAPDSF